MDISEDLDGLLELRKDLVDRVQDLYSYGRYWWADLDISDQHGRLHKDRRTQPQDQRTQYGHSVVTILSR